MLDRIVAQSRVRRVADEDRICPRILNRHIVDKIVAHEVASVLQRRVQGRGGGGSTTLADATEFHSAAGAVGEGAVRNDNALGSVVGACRNALSVSVVFVPSLSWQNPRFSAAEKGAKKGMLLAPIA